MMIHRDPAGTTPATTGQLCLVCNSRNPTDRSAQHTLALWHAAVALADKGEASRRYLGRHYWANAAMHGSDTARLEEARRCCTHVLRAQIEALSPAVVVAGGVQAATSLFHIGLIAHSWRDFRNQLRTGAYSATGVLDSGQPVAVYCTYHPSATAVNCEVKKMYSASTEQVLAQKLATLTDRTATDSFLKRYPSYSPEGQGMRVLLMHWLDIGEAIRRAHWQTEQGDRAGCELG